MNRLVLLCILLPSLSARAGECLEVGDDNCGVCINTLLSDADAFRDWIEYAGRGRTDSAPNIPTCDPHCDSACLFAKPVGILLDADSERAALVLRSLGPYRSCAAEYLPALKMLRDRYASLSLPMQTSIRSIMANLHTEGAGFADMARDCLPMLTAWHQASKGELHNAIGCGLAQVGIWENNPAWLGALQKDPAVEACLLKKWYPMPLKGYLSKAWARGLRYLSNETLRRLRNGVFAVHGRKFKDPALQAFFDGQSWYSPNEKYSKALLNRANRYTLKAIAAEEKRRK